MTFDFDEWMHLHHSDPAAFEQRRREVLTEMIATSPLSTAKRAELCAVLFAPGRELQDPASALADAQRLMWKAFEELRTVASSVHIGSTPSGCVTLRKTALAEFTKTD
jgi:hypothetical protein